MPRNSEALLKALKYFEAQPDFDRLCEAGSQRIHLLWRLAALSYSRGKDQSTPAKLSTRDARTMSKRIRDVADLIEALNKRPFANSILVGENFQLTDALPKELRFYADRVDELPRRIAKGGKQLQTVAICQLVWYVKQSTGREHDEEVAALIGAILRDDQWTTAGLKRWRVRV